MVRDEIRVSLCHGARCFGLPKRLLWPPARTHAVSGSLDDTELGERGNEPLGRVFGCAEFQENEAFEGA